MEIAKLQNENFRLSEQLSVTKIKSDESTKNKYQYASQLKKLEDEREIIVTDIKQLELESIGDTALSPNNCTVEDILESLDRIRSSFKMRTAKSSSLERTLLKVQTSSQLLLSKADEAKKIVEREKQKIINEKEDAIKDKQNMETELLNLKARLENQISNDRIVIDDLEATIANQKLIIERVNKSTQQYILKLEEELQALKTLYQNSVESVGELQEKLKAMAADNSTQLVMIKEIKADFEKKSNEVVELQKQLEELKKKPHHNVAAQANIKNINRNIESQTDNENVFIDTNKVHSESRETKNNTKVKNIDRIDILEETKLPLEKKHTQTKIKADNRFGNEVHVVTAAVEQPFDYDKRLDQNSIACSTDKDKSENKETMSTNSPMKSQLSEKISTNANEVSIDCLLTVDVVLKGYAENNDHNTATESKEKSTEYVAVRGSSESDSNIISDLKDKVYEISSSDKSTDKDLFVIYKDSNSSYNKKQEVPKDKWSRKRHSDVIVEAVTVHPTKKGASADMSRPKTYLQENKEIFEENTTKRKIIVKPPRVLTESPSAGTTSDVDKKSLDSYTIALYSSPKQFSDSESKINEGIDVKTINQIPREKASYDNESHHKLSRVGADVLLLKAEQEQKGPQTGRAQTFGLEYIMDTVLGEVDPDSEKYIAAQELRKTRSDERFNLIKLREKIDSSPSRLSEYKASYTDYKSYSSNSKSSDKSPTKSYNERSVMVKLDSNQDYEARIQTLTWALENIEKDCKKKIDAIKMQYDNNIKSIINEHNLGVKSIQSLHEETLQDIIKRHESEVENLRSMSIEAMKKADKLEKENRALRKKVHDPGTFDEVSPKLHQKLCCIYQILDL